MATIQEGDLVMALRGQPDEDIGRVRSVEGDIANVAWESGVVTPCPMATLEPITAEERLQWLARPAVDE